MIPSMAITIIQNENHIVDNIVPIMPRGIITVGSNIIKIRSSNIPNTNNMNALIVFQISSKGILNIQKGKSKTFTIQVIGHPTRLKGK